MQVSNFTESEFTDQVPNPLDWWFGGWGYNDRDEFVGKIEINQAFLIGFKSTGQRSLVDGIECQHHIVISSSPKTKLDSWCRNQFGGLVATTRTPQNHATRQIHLTFPKGMNKVEMLKDLSRGADLKAQVRMYGDALWVNLANDLWVFDGFDKGIQCPLLLVRHLHVDIPKSFFHRCINMM